MKLDITIITGFLGAGKSSFLSRILGLAEYENATVIINEMGEESLDHLLVETLSEDVFPISAGCICCSSHSQLNAFLVSKLQSVDDKETHKIFIETSGVSDAVALLSHINAEPALSGNFGANTICLVSVARFDPKQLSLPEFVNQIASADLILLTKADTLSKHERDKRLGEVTSLIGKQVTPAPILLMPQRNEPLPDLLKQLAALGPTDAIGKRTTQKAHGFDYKTLTIEHPVEDEALIGFLEMLQYRFGQAIFRIKGFAVNAHDATRPRLIQIVGTTEIHLDWLENWTTKPRTAITVIFRNDGIESPENFGDQLQSLFSSWFNLPMPDTADRVGLETNPLSVTGLGAFNPHSFRQTEPD